MQKQYLPILYTNNSEEPLESIILQKNLHKSDFEEQKNYELIIEKRKKKNNFLQNVDKNIDENFNETHVNNQNLFSLKKNKNTLLKEKICVSCGTIFIINYILNLINPSISSDQNNVANLLFPLDQLLDPEEINLNKEYLLKNLPNSKFNQKFINFIKKGKETYSQPLNDYFLNPFLSELTIASKKIDINDLRTTEIFYKIGNVIHSTTIEQLLETKNINYKLFAFISEYYINIQDAFSINVMNILSRTIKNNSKNNPIEYKNVILFDQMGYWETTKYRIKNILHINNFKFYIF